MPWLTRGGEVLARLEIAGTASSRARGLLGRDGIEGALLLRPCRGIHTIGLRFDVDVAYCDRSFVVLETLRMARNRMGRFRLRAHAVLEAEAGAFERWRLRPGDALEVRD